MGSWPSHASIVARIAKKKIGHFDNELGSRTCFIVDECERSRACRLRLPFLRAIDAHVYLNYPALLLPRRQIVLVGIRS